MENGNNRHTHTVSSNIGFSLLKYSALQLTVDGEKGGVGDSLPRHVARHTAVVGGVRELGLRHEQVPRAGDDEVGVHRGVDLLPVPQPAEDSGLGLASWWVTSQLPLLPNFDVGRVGRGLEIFAQI